MQHINLVDERLLPPRPRPSGAVLLGGFVAALCAVAVHGVIERQGLAAAVAGMPAASAEEVAPAAPSDALVALQQRVAQRRALLDTLEAAQPLPRAPAEALEGVLAALPDAAWLTEVDLHGARGLRIAGGVLEPSALVPLARRLAQLPTLAGVPIGTVRLTRDPGSDAADASDDAAAARVPSHRFVFANLDSASEASR
jgi:hypothetical protein